ncbi:MAG: hypothetical protein HC849_23540 [Oscillatoriales cyanobacterium RU_3_3]|nr:hypothetical protein [Oscillatoriales cyanobacterium RU_3_3]
MTKYQRFYIPRFQLDRLSKNSDLNHFHLKNCSLKCQEILDLGFSIVMIFRIFDKTAPPTVNFLLLTVNCQLSTVNCQLSTVNYQLSFPSTILNRKSIFSRYEPM